MNVQARTRCINLTTKSDFYRDPTVPMPYDPGSGSTAIWWCALTSKSLGPDGAPCDLDACAAGRACYIASARRRDMVDLARQGDLGI